MLGNEFWTPEFWTRVLGSNFLALFFFSKRGPLKNSPSRNSPPKIHVSKFNPEIGPKNSHCTSAGPFGISVKIITRITLLPAQIKFAASTFIFAELFKLGRSFYLRVSCFYLRLVFVAYGQLAWSGLLTVEIQFGLFLGQPVCRTKLPRKILISKRKMVRKTTRNFPEKC